MTPGEAAPPLMATGARGLLRAGRRVGIGAAAVAAVALTTAIAYEGARRYGFGYGSRAYWLAWRGSGLYDGEPEKMGSYLYTPVFAQILWPLTLLPWVAFAALWASLTSAAFAWLLWPLSWPWRLLAFLLVVPEIVDGNIWALFAVVLVIGFRHPAAWAFPLLTKVTAGVGIVWFAVRREWRQALLAVGITLILIAGSFMLDPSLWHDYVRFATDGGGRGSSYATDGRLVPPVARLPIAFVLVVLAARRDRRSWLVWAMLLAAPVFGTYNFALLAAMPRIREAHTGGAA